LIDAVRRGPRERLALIDPARDEQVRYHELLDRVDATASRLLKCTGGSALAFLAMGADIESVVLYLACLAARLPVCLVEAEPESLARMIGVYSPSIVLAPPTLELPTGMEECPGAGSYRWWTAERDRRAAVNPELALLLTTSGSTGSPKLVRLTRRNLESNADAIARYLELDGNERAVASLPMHYSYGLSVLNSHLLAGGAVVLTAHSFLRPEFWGVVDDQRCTSFAGVPYMYETLHRLRFDPGRHPTLRTYTQAGGALRPELIDQLRRASEPAGARVFIMYGQTEATARISYVPPADLARKLGSIGVPIPGGTMRLAPVEDSESQELVYSGPNVMMGYAESPEDLALGDVLRGTLRTGDLASVDDDGFFRLVGRLARFAKLFGRRISLEDVEREIESRFPLRAAALDGGDRLILHVEPGALPSEVASHLSRMLNVPPAAIEVVERDALPRTSSGKKDYRALEPRP